ncbi:MAG: hypothetical protein U7123_23025 [Potamolinea sp.]
MPDYSEFEVKDDDEEKLSSHVLRVLLIKIVPQNCQAVLEGRALLPIFR